jgi:hypothetical protein
LTKSDAFEAGPEVSYVSRVSRHTSHSTDRHGMLWRSVGFAAARSRDGCSLCAQWGRGILTIRSIREPACVRPAPTGLRAGVGHDDLPSCQSAFAITSTSRRSPWRP